MTPRDEIVAFLDALLDPAAFADYGPNGLQVPGASEVSRVVTGVSAHLELFERAAASGAQAVLCHHGLFWERAPRALDARMKARLKALFDADLSLLAYHLPLDAHPEVGNNALLAKALGLTPTEPFAPHRGRPIGVIAAAPAPLAVRELLDRVAGAVEREPLLLPGGPDAVRRVGIVSGGGASSLGEAAALGLDAFITGEPAEPAMADAAELGVHFIAAGHYATETFGVRRLGELLEERFGVEHEFVPIPNPV